MLKRGTVTIVFDDGYQRTFDNALPLLKKHKLPAVFALPLNSKNIVKAEQRKAKPWQQWLFLSKSGHEIASHSISHSNLTKLSNNKLLSELSEPAARLNASTIVYPGGALNDRVINYAKRYYSAGRTIHYGFETIPPANPLRLKSYNFSSRNFSILKANLLVFWAWLTNSWLIETYHMIDNNEKQMVHTVKTKDLDQHLSFISALPINVRTISDVVGPLPAAYS